LSFSSAQPPRQPSRKDAASYFEENCTACHTIGEGELNGPDLKGVTRLRDVGWLHQFIANPEALVVLGVHILGYPESVPVAEAAGRALARTRPQAAKNPPVASTRLPY
jgi:hypothetical protein